MAQLNYNHLHYFWVVATVGSIAKAAESLHVTPQTISGQLRTLEERLGSALFRKTGKRLELTATGQIVRSYTEPMFALALELRDVLTKRTPRRSSPLAVGVATSVPKLVAYRVLSPALRLGAGTRVVCSEAAAEQLAADIPDGKLDLAITDRPTFMHAGRVQSHLVHQCRVAILGARDWAERYRAGFPRSLDGAPFVLPARTSALRDALLGWFRREQIAPSIVAEIESPDLIAALCATQGATFAAPASIARDIERTCVVGETPIEQQFYASSASRHGGHELIAAIIGDAHVRSCPQGRCGVVPLRGGDIGGGHVRGSRRLASSGR